MFLICKYYKFVIYLIAATVLLGGEAYAETIVGGVIGSNAEWQLSGSPYIITSNLTIAENATLIMEEGVEIRLNPKIDINVKGVLKARGTKESIIRFTANSEYPKNPFWGSIIISSNNNVQSEMEFCKIEFSGKSSHGPIVFSNGNLSVLSNIILVNNKYNGIELDYGVIDGILTLSAHGLPYFTLRNIVAGENSIIRILPGVVVKFAESTDMVINGALIAEGKPGKNIIFTSINDDSADSVDTDGGGATTGKSYDWGGIIFTDKSDSDISLLSNAIIRFGGGTSSAGSSLLYFDDASAKIESCTLSVSGYFGATCMNTASPDFGGGQYGSIGSNIFEGFSPSKYAIFNRSKSAVYTQYNCWGTQDSLEIKKLIYDYEDKSRYGAVIFQPFKDNCNPAPPLAPELIYPPNSSKGIPTIVKFRWKGSSGADFYSFQLAMDTAFADILHNIIEISDTSLEIGGLDFYINYYWRAKAQSAIGESPWSQVFHFKTLDTAKPKIPELLSPEIHAEGIFCTVDLVWQAIGNAEKYRLQVAFDEAFQYLYFEDCTIIGNLRTIRIINENKYYWRVNVGNINGWSGWSETRDFFTEPCPLQEPPPNWIYEKRTGDNSTILIRSNVNALPGGGKLASGDAVGVFYYQGDKLVCGGYSVWEVDKNMAITAWGDNYQTPEIKDGFDFNEYFKFIVWDAAAGAQIPLAVEYESGLGYFFSDTLTVLKSFKVLDSIIIRKEKPDWRFVSSNVSPFWSFMDSLIPPAIICTRDEDGNTFYPEKDKKTLQNWDAQKGYEVYSTVVDSIKIKGSYISPENSPIILSAGKMHIVTYLPKEELSPDEALTSIKSRLAAAINSDGNIYIPELGFNQIEVMKPGEGYKIVLKSKDTLIYPLNTQGTSGISSKTGITQHFICNLRCTGSLSVLIIESAEFKDGDEIGAYDSSHRLIGSGAAKSGRTIFSIWGDNFITENIEGPVENDRLSLVLWSILSNREYPLYTISIKDFVTNSYVNNELKFYSDAIYRVVASKNPQSVEDSGFEYLNSPHNEPNPFNDNTVIEYILNKECNVKLDVYDSMGRCIETLINQVQQPGDHYALFDGNKYCNGIYFYKLSCGNEFFTNKMILIK